MGLRFTPLAVSDLEEIGDYIAQDNPARAHSFVMELRRQCEKIHRNPLGYRARPELAEGLRSCAFRHYVILFRPEGANVLIVRMLHGAMDIPVRFVAQEDAP
jgi:toxin ParE1/3/4